MNLKSAQHVLKRLPAMIAGIALMSAATAFAVPTAVTGAYSTGDGSDGNQATPLGSTPPYNMTATNTTFSYVLRGVNEDFTFAQLTDLNAVFEVNAGGSGGGAPRLRVLLDYDSSGGISAGDRSMSIYLGDSPSYINDGTVLQTYSGFNVIGDEDAGRYDTSAFVGGSSTTQYSNALALLGTYDVLRLGFILDTFGTLGDRDLDLASINATADIPAAVPVPGTVALLGLGLAALGFRRRKQA